ncbi:DUF1993 domain-containing protein [Sphingobium phenoxybenzoativorans]|uniref:DUF1993 domain-containing protein n=1 Tax=Sphingobium phenoxybenzoativorans TaxID=1592790 RepID=A0A975KAN0_9SPHN|nr:DUF1993 domain-containing protein [Sphingobium phenoxybenzoativorans]QUT07444.1 DUF1993 domain-containing protein [Sphingobium phenoxybenzoativorans]
MSLSLYDVSVPVFVRSLGNLAAILEKSRAFADAQGISHTELLDARLFDDMAPLTAQIQRASDTARFTAARVGQVEMAPIADDETSFDDLQARIAATIAALKAVPATCMDGREDAEVILKTPKKDVSFTGKTYVLNFAVPNFFFHVTTAYDILRYRGVPVGKLDFLGGI